MTQTTSEPQLSSREFDVAVRWQLLLEVVVSGVPKAQPRVRHCVRQMRDGRQLSMGYTPPVADDWKARIIQEIDRVKPARPLSGPVRVDITWLLPRPKSACRKSDPDGPVFCITKPDRDNLDKCILDAMTQIRVWDNDKQVVAGTLVKLYHAKGGRPGARIRIFVPHTDPVPTGVGQRSFL